MMTNRYCQAVGSEDAVESHKRFGPVLWKLVTIYDGTGKIK